MMITTCSMDTVLYFDVLGDLYTTEPSECWTEYTFWLGVLADEEE